MNKTALKNFATSARRELLKKVEAKAMKIGITESGIKKADIESSDAIFIDGRQLSKEEKIQRDKLIDRIKQTSFSRVMEEVSYTWFNRFTALRFMEVNDYLPTKVRVLSSSNVDSAEPDMMIEALTLDLDIDKEYVYDLKLNNNSEELFKYLIIKHCNDLYRYMPFMFEKIDDFTEILFPEGLLAKDSFLKEMIDTNKMPEKDWNQIEVIGWLYQFYIAEEKERVFKQKSKYTAEEIPYATQLFTPEWIVRYMVQNSLGRYWIESHPEHSELLKNWEFYLENPNSNQDLELKLAPYLNNELRVEDIKCFDPAMGSGHILVYMFDVLFEIYSKCGYMDREIPRLIIENNLYGLDIDDRAYQLACFSVVMKALEYNKRFLRNIEREGLTLHLASIQETNIINDEVITYIAGQNIDDDYFAKVKRFIKQFHDAKTLGSLINVEVYNDGLLEERLRFIQNNPAHNLFEEEKRKVVMKVLPDLLKQARIMFNKYDILVTNPPYMGGGKMNKILSNFLKEHYPDSKSDLFATFMELNCYLKDKGIYSSINQHSWMFLSRFENLRKKVLYTKNIVNMLHLGARTFEEISGEVVQSTAFVLRNYKVSNLKGTFVNLTEMKNPKLKKEKTLEILRNRKHSNLYLFNQDEFNSIPGSPLTYWVSDNIHEIFEKYKPLYDFTTSASQNVTGNNNKYLRFHWEVNKKDIGKGNRWIFYAKGGGYRKWYGNLLDVVDWSFEAREAYRTGHASQIIPEEYWYRKGITWGLITTVLPSFRVLPEGSTFDKGGSSIFIDDPDLFNYILGFLNSNISIELMKCLNVTLNFQVRDVRNLPLVIDKFDEVNQLVTEVIELSKADWDSYETSSDFATHPYFIINKDKGYLSELTNDWIKTSNGRNAKIYSIERRLNDIFSNIYKMDRTFNEKSTIGEENIESNKNEETKNTVTSFISYAIGCILGRYSIDKEGILYGGGSFDSSSQYGDFKVDVDNILPILPGAYFEDDIVSRFIEFVKVNFGEQTLVENLDFIADTFGKKKGETAKETIRRYFLNEFFKDHVQTYKKRPIYWLFTSGQQKAFNCLIYIHRYDKTTLSRIRTDYLHEYQIRLDAERRDLLAVIEGDSTVKEISNAKKELKSLEKKIEELKEYDELLHHMADMQIEIDLDDGVAVNYEKFNGLLAKI